MGRVKIAGYDVRCDYPAHKSSVRTLHKGCLYHLLGDYIVCNDCWSNEMTFETLLECINQHHEVLNAGLEK